MSKHIIARPALRRTSLAMLLAATLAAAGCATQPSLSERWAELQRSQPKLHTRDAARELGVKESALLATQVGRNAVRLKGDPADIEALFERLPELGRIKAITRNEDAVLERSGGISVNTSGSTTCTGFSLGLRKSSSGKFRKSWLNLDLTSGG